MSLVLAHGEVLARTRRHFARRVLLVDEKAMRKGRGNFSTILTDGDSGRVVIEAHPELGVVWALVQRTNDLRRLDSCRGRGVGQPGRWRISPTPIGVDLRRAITFARWGNESQVFQFSGRDTNARAEGLNNKIECIERRAYGFKNRKNYETRVLLVCSGHPLR